MGVFATRSPFRPNGIGLSSVMLEKIEVTGKYGPVLYVSGADMINGTPIIDIKPYLPYTDSHPDASGGFADNVKDYSLSVDFADKLLNLIPSELHDGIINVLSQDPRPSYQNDEKRVYGFEFAGYEIKFTVSGGKLTVQNVDKIIIR